jgi:MurNAc alpha-1-phosphate uridylyltransferase
VNADIFTDLDYITLKNMNLDNFKGHLVMVKNPPHHMQGDFVLKHNKIELEGNNKLTFSGLAIYRPEIFEEINMESVEKLAPILKKLIDAGCICGEEYHGLWFDIGTPKRLEEINFFLKNNNFKS